LLALKAGFTGAGRQIMVGDIHTGHKVVVHHVCDSSGVKVTEVSVPEVE